MYVKGSESLCTQVNVWVNTILKHIDTRTIFPRYGSSCMVYKSEWNKLRNYHPIPIPTSLKKWEILIRDIWMVFEEKRIRDWQWSRALTLLYTLPLFHDTHKIISTSCSILKYIGWSVQVIVYTRGLLLFAFNFHITDTYEMYKVGVQQAGEYKVAFIIRRL